MRGVDPEFSSVSAHKVSNAYDNPANADIAMFNKVQQSSRYAQRHVQFLAGFAPSNSQKLKI